MSDGGLGIFITIFLVFALYFLPAIVALKKKKKNAGAILLTNLIFGWTFIGWVIALIWSATND